MMRVMMTQMPPSPSPSDPWDVSIALFPFWRLDAKGGEVVLFRVSRGFLHGLDASAVFL